MASVYTVAQVTSYISHLFEEDFALRARFLIAKNIQAVICILP